MSSFRTRGIVTNYVSSQKINEVSNLSLSNHNGSWIYCMSAKSLIEVNSLQRIFQLVCCVTFTFHDTIRTMEKPSMWHMLNHKPCSNKCIGYIILIVIYKPDTAYIVLSQHMWHLWRCVRQLRTHNYAFISNFLERNFFYENFSL